MIEDNDIHPPLRVAQMVDNLHTGGAEQMVVQIANARAEAGDASFLYVLRDGGELVEKVQPTVTLRNLHCQRASVASPFHFLESLRRGHRTLAQQIHIIPVWIIFSTIRERIMWGEVWRESTPLFILTSSIFV